MHVWSLRLAPAIAAVLLAHTPGRHGAAAEPPAAIAPRPSIVAASRLPPDRPARDAKPSGVTRRDYEALRETLPQLETIVPVREVRRTARRGDQSADVALLGTTPAYISLHALEVQRGRFLAAADQQRSSNVAVIDVDLARRLFLTDNPVGRNLGVGRHYYTIVGVTTPDRGGAKAGSVVYIPLSTMSKRIGDREIVRSGGVFSLKQYELSRIEIRVRGGADLPVAAALIEKVLDQLHDDQTYVVSSHPKPAQE